MSNPLVERRGATLDLGPCIVGINLNVLVVRGFAGIDELADISCPDVFDQVANPTGTQRDLKPKHAEECFEYAMDSLNLAAEDEPRCFPEIILNARDSNVVEIYNLEDPGELFDLSSFSDLEELETDVVGVRIRISDIEYPKPVKSPQISRVDGNHRLSHVDKVLEAELENGEEALDFPTVGFSMLVGLNNGQEARLFRDVNGEHVGMETAHLDSIIVRITDPEDMKHDPKLRPLWLAHQLAQDGHAFQGQVFFGGAKAGLKKQDGVMPPIKINSLKSTIAAQIKAAPMVSVGLQDKPDHLLVLLDRYWNAVREAFPDAWQDRKEYILLQSIGLGAFAKLGGHILDRAWDAGNVDPDDFKAQLAPVSNVSLKRADYPGIAGAGGAEQIAKILLSASEPSQVTTEKNVASLSKDVEQESSPLDS